MIIGVRAHDFGKQNIEDLAKKIGNKGFPCIQLALGKAVAGIDSSLGKLNPGMANYIRETLYKENIHVAVMGCYINPIHPDPIERRKSLERFKEHIRYARDFGCSIVGTETGSMNADFSYNPATHSEEALQILIESVKELVEEAEKFGVLVCIEGVTSHSVSTPQKMKRVLDTIQSNNLQVIFDPVNFLSIENYQNQDEIIKESFELFGDRIVILHAKDFIIEDGKMVTVETGKGLLNYELLIKLTKVQKPYIQVLLENATEDTAQASKKYIEDIYARV